MEGGWEAGTVKRGKKVGTGRRGLDGWPKPTIVDKFIGKKNIVGYI